uniref:F-box family protein n=1 Tax=Pithovirus LCPAC401 TaxID=2506595 RepID=A0A481ZD43_9VIRU|nr:MAG: F-box family protein [Pithovirus LCPAC401]
MTSVSEILTRLNLNRRDLNNISLSQLRTIFKDLTVKEISKLCAVSRKFNSICEDESLWRNKASDDYGIHKKYGNTWRQTARNMDKVNMINLGAKWIDGSTYMKILNNALQNGARSVINKQEQYLFYFANNSTSYVDDLQWNIENNDIQLQIFANEVLGRDYTEEELNDIYYIKNREIDIIYVAVLTYKGMRGGLYLPGGKTADIDINTVLPSYDFLRDMIDPILYIMQFSSFSFSIL